MAATPHHGRRGLFCVESCECRRRRFMWYRPQSGLYGVLPACRTLHPTQRAQRLVVCEGGSSCGDRVQRPHPLDTLVLRGLERDAVFEDMADVLDGIF